MSPHFSWWMITAHGRGLTSHRNTTESLGAQNSWGAAKGQQLLGQWHLVLKPLAIISIESCWIIKAPLQMSVTALSSPLQPCRAQWPTKCCCSPGWASSSQPHWNATHGTQICFVAASEDHYRTSHPQRWSYQHWCAMRGTHTKKSEFLNVHPNAKADFPSLGGSAIYLWFAWASGWCTEGENLYFSCK